MSEQPDSLTIDCTQCHMFRSDHCSDCVVTYLCDRTDIDSPSADTAVVFDLAELRAMKMLADAGLVPTLRHSATG